MKKVRHPMQPIEIDSASVARFKANSIIDWLWETGNINLNEIVAHGFPDEDLSQLAQLLGYSVSGYRDLSYARPEDVRKAMRKAKEISKS